MTTWRDFQKVPLRDLEEKNLKRLRHGKTKLKMLTVRTTGAAKHKHNGQ
jgi:hypothetical protein